VKTFWVAAFALFLSVPAWAISEQNYAQDMANLVMPFYATGVQGSFAGISDVPISYIKFENPKEIGAIVLVNGRADNYLFYAEAIYDLTRLGYSVYAFDHRGQGSSGRMLADSQIGNVENFNDYVDDMKTFVDTVVNAVPHNKRYVFSFSMGGTISTLYGLKYPHDFDAYSFTSPMYGFSTAPYSNWIAHFVVDLEVFFGKAHDWAKGQGPYYSDETFADNIITTSEVRWIARHQVLIDHPEVQLGGPSNRWLQQALSSTSAVLKKAKKFQPPAIVFQAGDDQVVIASDEAKFCSKARNCVMGNTYPNGEHELIREQDYIRSDLYARSVQFFSQN
jgi:lysophospholipase